MYTPCIHPKPCIFVLDQSWQIQNLVETKTVKKKRILSFFTAKLSGKAKNIEIFAETAKMDEEDEHFIILKIWKLLMQKLQQASRKVRKP